MNEPRNHARRVEDLQEMEKHDLLRYLEARRDDRGGREYVVHIAGEPEPRPLPGRGIDLWLDGARSMLTAIAAGATRLLARAGHTDAEDPTRRNTDGNQQPEQ